MESRFWRRTVQGMGIALALAVTSPAWAVDYMLVIDLDANGCPTDVTVEGDRPPCPADPKASTICVKRGQRDKIGWKTEAPNPSFTIYFDPFRPRGTPSNAQGILNPRTIDAAAPATTDGISYEYTVVVDGCPDKPLDPRIIVER